MSILYLEGILRRLTMSAHTVMEGSMRVLDQLLHTLLTFHPTFFLDSIVCSQPGLVGHFLKTIWASRVLGWHGCIRPWVIFGGMWLWMGASLPLSPDRSMSWRNVIVSSCDLHLTPNWLCSWNLKGVYGMFNVTVRLHDLHHIPNWLCSLNHLGIYGKFVYGRRCLRVVIDRLKLYIWENAIQLGFRKVLASCQPVCPGVLMSVAGPCTSHS